MEFFDLIQLCHDKTRMSIVMTETQPAVRCEACGSYPLKQIYDYIQNLEGFESCRVAQAYEALTKDSQVPVSFYMVDVDGILPKRIIGQALYRLRAAVSLFKVLNAPFTEGGGGESRTIFDDCLRDFAAFIHSTKELYHGLGQEMIVHVFQHLVSVTENVQKMDFYFDTLVPYVLACEDSWTPLPPNNPEENLAKQLVYQFQRSNQIRKTFGKYSMHFDLFPVMAGTYICSADMTVSVNWVADFAARICLGHYFWKNYKHLSMVKEIERILSSEVSYKKNTHLYYVVKSFKQGIPMECMSENFEKYLQLNALIRDKYRGPLVDTVLHHLFPTVLMDTSGDTIGFMFSMMYVLTQTSVKDGSINKGTFSKARKIYDMGKRICAAFQDFTKDTPLTWTADTLEMFLATFPNLATDINVMVQTLIPDE